MNTLATTQLSEQAGPKRQNFETGMKIAAVWGVGMENPGAWVSDTSQKRQDRGGALVREIARLQTT